MEGEVTVPVALKGDVGVVDGGEGECACVVFEGVGGGFVVEDEDEVVDLVEADGAAVGWVGGGEPEGAVGVAGFEAIFVGEDEAGEAGCPSDAGDGEGESGECGEPFGASAPLDGSGFEQDEVVEGVAGAAVVVDVDAAGHVGGDEAGGEGEAGGFHGEPGGKGLFVVGVGVARGEGVDGLGVGGVLDCVVVFCGREFLFVEFEEGDAVAHGSCDDGGDEVGEVGGYAGEEGGRGVYVAVEGVAPDEGVGGVGEVELAELAGDGCCPDGVVHEGPSWGAGVYDGGAVCGEGVFTAVTVEGFLPPGEVPVEG